MNQEDAYKILAIRPPFAEHELKSAFRKAVLELHPDQGGDAKEFIRAKEAFEFLKPEAGRDRIVDVITLTVDGIPLSKLGLGKNAGNKKPCTWCGGRGYYSHQAYEDEIDWTGIRSIFDYMHFRNQRRKAVTRHYLCNVCNGSGVTSVFNPVLQAMAFRSGRMTQKQRKKATQ